MCQVLIIPNLSRIKSLGRLVNSAAKHLLARDDDGFGWAALGKAGVFGERTTAKEHCYRLNKNNMSVKIPFFKEVYNSFGKRSDLIGAGLFHGRTSTNVKNLKNTHPIIRNDWTLIHNGVVNNLGPAYDMLTENDTEHIVHYLSTLGIEGIEKNLSGYYASGAIAPNGHLHIIRDDTARLFTAWNESISSYIFATTQDLIKQVSRDLGWKIGPIEAVMDNVYLVFDQSGELIEQRTIKPIGWTKRESTWMQKSLHTTAEALGPYKATRSYDEYDYGNWDDSALGLSTINAVAPAYSNTSTDQDEEAYLELLKEVDETFDIYDRNGKLVELYEFHSMDRVSKLDCDVYCPDGSIFSFSNAWTNAYE